MTKYLPLALGLAATLALSACQSSSAGTQDGAIATAVNTKLAADPALQGAKVTATALNGVVTLSGNVNSDAARSAAQTDAQVPGVTQVDNQIGTVSVATPAAASVAASAPATAAAAPAMTAVQPVEVESGTTLSVRLDQTLSSADATAGQSFDARLAAPILVNGQIAIPKGAAITGTVTAADSAGHFKGQSRLVLQLTQVSYDGNSYNLSTGDSTHLAASRSTRSGETIGGGAALGALVGALAGHGKGAAIGAAAGAGAGTATQALTKPAEVNLTSETALKFTLTNPIQVVPAATAH